MPNWLSGILIALLLSAPAQAQEAATRGQLPEVLVVTALKSGDWDDLGDLIGEALGEATDFASDYNMKLTTTEVVIYEMSGLKNFRARIGYVIDPSVKAKPGRYGKTIDLRRLKGPAYVASGVGGAASVIAIRRKALNELEKPGVRRLKGIDTIEFFYGDMDDKETKVEVYGPLR